MVWCGLQLVFLWESTVSGVFLPLLDPHSLSLSLPLQIPAWKIRCRSQTAICKLQECMSLSVSGLFFGRFSCSTCFTKLLSTILRYSGPRIRALSVSWPPGTFGRGRASCRRQAGVQTSCIKFCISVMQESGGDG
ncbi:hypothetical protein BJY01DRAFT_230608 [Aspergillus pseudoustus]|uniref:Secreted protein n=1 Tax=Aspergillus pseudoustus TaxID=1810923 RepID=A0ABR4I7X7_9EURO